MNTTEKLTLSRREILKGAGALVVSFSLFGPAARLLAQSGLTPGSEPEATALDSWVAVKSDGTVTIFSSKVDLGTGIMTALSQICAEELDVPFNKVRMETGDTSQTIDQAATVGSQTIRRGGPQLRQASAAARLELLKMAAAKFSVPVDQLTVTDGVITTIGKPAKKVTYAQLVGGKRFNVRITATGSGGAMTVAPEVKPKDPKTYKIVGASEPRVDLPPKFTGEFTYTADVRVPGMLHGRVVRPPTFHSAPYAPDESTLKGIPGIVKVVREGNFIGVVAQTEWAAIQAAGKLDTTWSGPQTKYPMTREEVFTYLKTTKSARDQSVVNRGNVDTAIQQGSRIYEATYQWPFQDHGMLGPSCAVADVRADGVTIWAGSQGTFNTRKQISALLGVPEKSVRVIYRESAGCYGRLSPDDVPLDAALMSRAVGKPVRVQWMRGDEHAWEPKGPAQLITVRVALDSSGKVIAWDYLDRSFPWTENGNPLLAAQEIGHRLPNPGLSNGVGGGGQDYHFENQRVSAAMIPWIWPDPIPLRTSNLRAPGDVARSFASETAMDDLASITGVDPIEFRLRYLSDQRIIDVLNAAAKQAQWKPHTSPGLVSAGAKAVGRGVAIANRGDTMTTSIADVEVDRSKGTILVKRITLAHDCGRIVNPDGLKNQIEGNIIQGVSRTLLEEVKFDADGVSSLDWVSYPILRFTGVPDIDIVLLNRPEMPSLGGGEPSIVAVPASIANAVFDAIGVRLRDVPLTPERVLAGLKTPVTQLQPAG